MTSRISTLKSLLETAIETRQTAGDFAEAFTLDKSWICREDFENLYTAQGKPQPIVWICPTPNMTEFEGRNGAFMETFRIQAVIFCPIESDAAIELHVQLTEELLDTIRQTAGANGYYMTSATPSNSDDGAPFNFGSMAQRAFFTMYEIRLQKPLWN
jgi:hypothetical protein